MIDRIRFANALGGLAATLPLFGREYSRQLQEVYWHALADLSDDDFERACARALRELKQFPTPSDLLERAPSRAHGALELQAARIFLAIVATPRHNPARGSYWREEDVRRQHGAAAADAFVMAGATAGFRAASDPDRERFIRRDFLAGYVAAATADPSARLPAPAEALPADVVAVIADVSRQLTFPRPRAGSVDEQRAAWRRASEGTS